MSDYVCRLMQEADLNEVLDIVQSAGAFAWSPQNILESNNSKNDSSFVLCAAKANSVLGYAVIHSVLEESQLLNLVIKKQEQNKGLGSYFLRQLIDYVKRQNQHSILLEVRASNALAIRLYEKMGFQQSGVRKDYYKAGETREDARLYSLLLS